MANDQKAAGDMIDRYVYQVVKHLPQEQRADIEKELRGLIEDMLSARSDNPDPGGRRGGAEGAREGRSSWPRSTGAAALI